jgi:hypothetical protein
MNEIASEQPLDDVIDLIVDGSLQPGELRRALAQLEREADGWKRCTLAFLEAQCWRDAFRAIEAPPSSNVRCDSDSIQLAPPAFHRPRINWWRGVAAVGIVAVSFALGWLSRVSRPGEPAGAVHSVSKNPLVAGQPQDSSSEPELPVSAVPSRSSRFEPEFAADPAPPGPEDIVQTVGQVQFGTEGGGATVPILAGPGINGDWLRAQPPPLSDSEQVVLERYGYQVDQRRRLLVATLADGRRVSVPIDQVEIRYTGTNPL